jgi:hypothetical protein
LKNQQFLLRPNDGNAELAEHRVRTHVLLNAVELHNRLCDREQVAGRLASRRDTGPRLTLSGGTVLQATRSFVTRIWKTE